MAFFIMLCLDKPGALELRKATREAHLAFARQHGDILRAGGPLLDADGGMTGSFLLFDAPDIGAVRAFKDEDPYGKAGLFARVEVHPWRQTVGAPI
jgi:uncharacterized protein YciI